MREIAHELCSGLRHCARSPGWALLVVVCLGVGIGTATMMFSVAEALLLESPPFDEPDRLTLVFDAWRTNPLELQPASYAEFLRWKARGGELAELGAAVGMTVRLTDPDVGSYAAARVTTNMPSVLGIRPILGRSFDDHDDAVAAPVVMLSEALWRSRFVADPEIVGRSVLVNGEAHTVVGVMPDMRGWAVPAALRGARLWMPLRSGDTTLGRDRRSLVVVGRLAPTIAFAEAATAFAAISDDLAQQYGEDADWVPSLRPLRGDLSPRTRSMLTLGGWAAAALLLVCCANAANLISARMERRRREIAVRAALGAAPGRIVRQLLVENAGLSLLGAAAGLAVAGWELGLLQGAIPAGGIELSFEIDGAVLAFAAGLAVLATLGPALISAVRASRGAGAREALSDAGPTASAGQFSVRVRDALVIGEVALSVVLLVSSLVLVRSFANLLAGPGTFDTSHLLAVRFEPEESPEESLEENRATSQSARADSAIEELLRSVNALPGVQSAAVSDFVPLRGGRDRDLVVPEGRGARSEMLARVTYSMVSPRFFETLRLPLMRGSELETGRSADEPNAAIVSKAMADRLWPGIDPLGQRFRFASALHGKTWTVIGVAPDIANWDFGDQPRPTVYVPLEKASGAELTMSIRSEAPSLLAPSVREALERARPGVSILEISPMEEVHRDIFWRQQTFAVMFAAFAVIATVIAGVGLYAVLSYLVASRSREIGIRMALGAKPPDVAALVLWRSLALVMLGLGLGVGGAYGVGVFLRRLLYEVSPTDGVTVAGVAVFSLAVATAASYGPALRAANVDPTRLLRT